MARRCWLALVPLWALCGCFTTETARPANLVKRWHTPVDESTVQIDVALIARPIGDPFINQELWKHTDNLIVGLERRPALEENGLRVGQLVGPTPQVLQDMLKSERWCINPRRRLVPAGKPVTQYLGNLLPQAQFEVRQGQTVEITLEQARFGLEVIPHLAKDGGIRLQVTPLVEHGEAQLPFKADPKQNAWVLAVEKPSRRFGHFGWEATLPPGALLIIGAHLDRPDSFGCQGLIDVDGPDRGQRILVIRTSRSLPGAAEPTLEDLARQNTALPLALQAGLSARAKGQ